MTGWQAQWEGVEGSLMDLIRLNRWTSSSVLEMSANVHASERLDFFTIELSSDGWRHWKPSDREEFVRHYLNVRGYDRCELELSTLRQFDDARHMDDVPFDAWDDEPQPLRNECLDALEAEHGITLAADYRVFLTLHNGGYLRQDRFVAGAAECRIDYLYPFRVDDRGWMPTVLDLWREHPALASQDLLVLGEGSSGYFLLRTGGEEFGSVCLWDQELEELTGSACPRSIAPSFSEFVVSLRPLDG